MCRPYDDSQYAINHTHIVHIVKQHKGCNRCSKKKTYHSTTQSKNAYCFLWIKRYIKLFMCRPYDDSQYAINHTQIVHIVKQHKGCNRCSKKKTFHSTTQSKNTSGQASEKGDRRTI